MPNIEHYNSRAHPTTLESESGLFQLDERGFAHSFEPAAGNPLVEETVNSSNYLIETSASIRTFIVPDGVKGFGNNFMRGSRIIEKMELPNSLVSLGTGFSNDNPCHCVFANCVLPNVKLPNSLREIGIFAFGHTYIEELYIPKDLKSSYGRQFKDSYIGTLYLPKAWENDAHLNRNGGIEASFISFEGEWGYLCWPSTKIGELKFY